MANATAPKRNVNVPNGSEQRRSSKTIGATSNRLVASTDVTACVSMRSSVVGWIGVNALRYIVKNDTRAITRVMLATVGRNERNDEVRETSSSDHAARSGRTPSASHPINSRCEGLRRAARSASIPKIWCHTMSPAPAAPKSTRPSIISGSICTVPPRLRSR